MTRVLFDVAEVEALAVLIKEDPERAAKAARDAGIVVGARIKRAASQAAPKDRPWLSLHGIRQRTWTDRRGSHTDVSTVRDEHGRNVGFFVEYGTSDTPPRPFLTSQMTWAADAFQHEVISRIDPLSYRDPAPVDEPDGDS